MSKHNDVVYVYHILDAIKKINQLVNRGGIVRELMVVGEASRSLSSEFKSLHNDIPWKDVVGMRDWLVHGYSEIDWDRVWNTATNDVPKLELQIQNIKGKI